MSNLNDLLSTIDDIGLDSSPYSVNDESPAVELLNIVFSKYIGDIARSWGEYYWEQDFYGSVIKEETFGFIWESYPLQREALLNVCVKAQSSETYYHRRDKKLTISEDFSKSIIERVYNRIVNDESYSDDTHLSSRLKFINYVEPDFDYLKKVSGYYLTEKLSEEAEKTASSWMKAGLKHSSDELFFDYAYDRIKRAPGSAKRKLEVVSCAMSKDALSDSLLRKIAKSSPKSIKRSVVSELASSIRSERYSDEESEKAANMEKNIMLFVANDDRQILGELIDCLSTDNLPWLMPYVSSYPYLARRLQYRLESAT